MEDIRDLQGWKYKLRQYWCSGKLENSLLGRDNIIKRVDPEDDHEEKDPGSPDLLGDPGVPPAGQDLGTAERLTAAVLTGRQAVVQLSRAEVDQFYSQPRIDHNVLVFNVTVDNGEIVQVRYCGKYLSRND